MRKRGHRLTRGRVIIVSLFAAAESPLTAETIIRNLRKAGASLNKTTVYRELDFLNEQGIVHDIEFGDGKKRYEISTREHHHHFICLNCKTIIDVRLGKELDSLEKELVRTKNVQILRHSLELFGLCKKCKIKL